MENEAMKRLVQRLVAIQQSEGITDEEMANRLGVGRSTWSYIKRGIYSPSLSTLGKINLAFPGLRKDVQEVIA